MRDVVEVALFTDDVAAATRFYRTLLESTRRREWPGGAIFAAGNTKLLVHERSAGVANGPPNEDHFALAAADLEGTCEELRARDSSSSSSRATIRGDARRISVIRTAGWSSSAASAPEIEVETGPRVDASVDRFPAKHLHDRPADDRTSLTDVDLQRPAREMDAQGLSHHPWTIAAAAAAAALEPDARVAPAPRSHTATVRSLGPSGRTSCTLVRSGKRW